MPALDFVAVDFETANGQRESACAVGVAVVRNGRVHSSDSWLIKPPPPADHFQRRNTAIHGITREQCMADGISWAETAQRLGRLCADLPVVAHNASFDESVWKAANRASGVEAPLPPFHCTLQLSRGHLDLADHKLPTVVRHLGLDDFPHHRAEADALAAAQVTMELARRTGASTVEQLWQRAPRPSATGSTSTRPAGNRRVPESVFRTSVDRPATGPSLADPDVPAPAALDGEVVVITGDLTFGTREEIQERLRLAGATAVQSTTQKTTCLVIGAGADVRNPPLTGATGKERKAVERIREGQRIAVIGEPELRELLEHAEAGVSVVDDDAGRPAALDDSDPVASLPVASTERPPDGQESAAADPPPSVWAAPPPSAHAPYATRPRQPWDRPHAVPHVGQQPWDPPPAAPASARSPRRRWVFHAVMWSIMLFLVVGMFLVGVVLSLMGVPESVWGAVIGISWLLAPLVFVGWLIAIVVRWLRSRRRGPARRPRGGPADAVASP